MSAAPEQVGEIIYTIFPDRTAQKKHELSETWDEIVQRIKSPRVAAEKSALPLISMGIYGDSRTCKGAYRHIGNLQAITGVEGDYDGETMPLEDAAERIGMAGVRAVLYTSPSHEANRPRWRILAPLSREYAPGERARLVARLNGILGGVLTSESFTTSQSFYIGRVEGREYEVIDLNGDCIDTRDEFDAHAIMPKGKSTEDGGVADVTLDAELRDAIRNGINFHEALRSLSARLVGRGMTPDDTVAVLHGLMEESTEKGTARWRERMAEIPRLVESAALKFRDRREPERTPEPPADQFPPIDVIAGEEGHSGGRPPESSEQDDENNGDDLALAAFDLDALMGPIEPERELLPGIPAEAYTLLAGGLATAKTTLLHSLLLARATGYDFLELTENGIETGPDVLVSYEDADKRIFRRFQILVQHQHRTIQEIHGPRSAREYLASVERNIRRVTLTGKAGSGIVCRDVAGNIVPNRALIDELVGKIKKFASSDVLIGLDPLRLAIVGSQNDDDGADVVVHVLNDIAGRLPNSGLIVPSHTTKSGAIEPGTGRAVAAYGTSGSALYSQHARSNFLMSRMKADDVRGKFGGDVVTSEEADQERVVQLTHARLSHGAESKERFYVMRSGVLVPVHPNAQVVPLAEAARRALPAMDEAIGETIKLGHRASRKALEAVVAIGRTRRDRRDLIDEAIGQGWLQEAGATSDKRIELTAAGRAQLSPSRGGESTPESD